MSKTKICMIVHKNYFRDVRVRRYVESLINSGCSVDVICPAEQEDLVSEKQDHLIVYSIPVHHADRSRLGYILEYLWAFVIYIVRTTALYFKNKYLVIHVHNMPDFLIFAGLIPKIAGAKLILDIHDSTPEVFISKYGEQKHLALLKLIVLQEKISCWLADSIISANSNVKTNLVKRGIRSSKITVINNFPNLDLFQPAMYPVDAKLPRDHFSLIYTGTIAPRYGLDIAIRALPELKSKVPEVSLQIIGPYSNHRDELMALAKDLDVADYVHFEPVIPNQEIPCKLMQADIGIYTALRDTHMDLATPTKLLEYAAMGLPIISSRMKAVGELFDDTSILYFEPGDVEQFIQCVLVLYENQAVRARLAHSANQKLVQNYSWSKEFLRYLTMLHKLHPVQSKAKEIPQNPPRI